MLPLFLYSEVSHISTGLSPYRFLSLSSSRPRDLTASSSRPTRRVLILLPTDPCSTELPGQWGPCLRAAGKHAVPSFRHLDAEMIVQTHLEMPSSRPTRRVLIRCRWSAVCWQSPPLSSVPSSRRTFKVPTFSCLRAAVLYTQCLHYMSSYPPNKH
jgi:hypothetical protein